MQNTRGNTHIESKRGFQAEPRSKGRSHEDTIDWWLARSGVKASGVRASRSLIVFAWAAAGQGAAGCRCRRRPPARRHATANLQGSNNNKHKGRQ